VDGRQVLAGIFGPGLLDKAVGKNLLLSNYKTKSHA